MLHKAFRFLAHGAWLANCLPAYVSFRRALRNPQSIQSEILQRLVSANAASIYGRKFHFASIRTAREFQDAIPLVDYDDLEPWVERVKHGEKNVLTCEPVLMFEKTSGSSGPAKYIPYTATLRFEFQRAIRAWIFDLYRQKRAMLFGSSYWSITPLARRREIVSGGLAVGFENDSEYLGRLEQLLLGRLLAVPNDVGRINDLESCLYATCRFLLQARDLAFISVWNPSFLTILCEYFQKNVDRLLDDLSKGTLRLPNGDPPGGALQSLLRSDPSRARHLEKLLSAGGWSGKMIWPKLQLISCWSDAGAASALPPLQKLFPAVPLQGKGLLSTEGIVSIPMMGRPGAALAVTSHFYEFVSSEGKRPHLAHELENGRDYSVVMTTGGGLWRYRTGDRVQVLDHIDATPLLKFLGREDDVSDLRGEKLHAAFVGRAIARLQASRKLCTSFAMLAPIDAPVPFYTLFVEQADSTKDLPHVLDELLRQNPHYDYCRRLGQLGPTAIFEIEDGGAEDYMRHCQTKGQRAGAVKATPLHKGFGWEKVFRGKFTRSTDVLYSQVRHHGNHQPEFAV